MENKRKRNFEYDPVQKKTKIFSPDVPIDVNIEQYIKATAKERAANYMRLKDVQKDMQYKNRYGDIITFTIIDDNHIKVEAMLKLGIGTTESEGNLTSIDFAGGPMIHVNDDLGQYVKELKGKKVKSIKFNEGVILEV